MASAEVVFLAIQAGVRVYQGLRRAYVTHVRDATLVLPLPRTAGLTLGTIIGWFDVNPAYIPAGGALSGLLRKAKENAPALTDDENTILGRAYAACWAERNPKESREADEVLSPGCSGREYLALLEVRQWERGQAGAPPSSLQQAAGSLIDTAVFWFANKPGAISLHRPEGRALFAFLKGVEKVDFAATPPRAILGAMMVGMLETVAAEPRLMIGGKLEETLVIHISGSLAKVIAARFAAKYPTTEEEADAASWAQLVAQTVLKTGVETTLADPKLFFGVKAGDEASVIQQVGATILSLILSDDPQRPRGVLGRLISGAELETIVRAALKAIANHPGVLGVGKDKRGVENLLAELVGAFSEEDVPATAAAAFSQIVKSVLEKSAANLDAVRGDHKDVGANILVIAAIHTLEVIKEASTGKAVPIFAREQMIGLFDCVLAEVAANPAWVVKSLSPIVESELLNVALEAALTALRQQKFVTLSNETRVTILKSAFLAASGQFSLLRQIPGNGQDAGHVAVEAAINAVFEELAACAADATARWRLSRSSLQITLFEVAFNKIVEVPVEEKNLQACIDALRTVTRQFAQGGMTLTDFADALGARMKGIH